MATIMATSIEIIKKYPTLYKMRTETKILEWTIIIQNNGGNIEISTTYGELDGNLINKKTVIEKGKGGRSIIEQAELEANRKYQDKIEKDNYLLDLKDKENEFKMRPMLANKFNFELYKKTGSRSYKIPFPSFTQPKYDGIRCISYLKNGDVEMMSRKGTAFGGFTEIKKRIKEIINELMEEEDNLEGIYLDGELFSDKLTFEEISGYVRRNNSECDLIQYHLYDIFIKSQSNLPFSKRNEILNSVNRMDDLIKWVKTDTVNKLEDIKVNHNKYIEWGFEGTIIRDKNGVYEVDKRSNYLQKYKDFLEDEFEIVGFKSEKTHDNDDMVIWICRTEDNKIFDVRPKGDFGTRKETFKNGGDYVGSLLTVVYQELTNDGIPRFGIGKCIRNFE